VAACAVSGRDTAAPPATQGHPDSEGNTATCLSQGRGADAAASGGAQGRAEADTARLLSEGGAVDALEQPEKQELEVSGLLGDGRWLQNVRVNAVKRKQRIMMLQQAKRLRVCLQMPLWREALRCQGVEGCRSRSNLQRQRPADKPAQTKKARKDAAGCPADKPAQRKKAR
jgi:hypothetical protein